MDRLVVTRDEMIIVSRPASRNTIEVARAATHAEFLRSGIPGAKGNTGDKGDTGSIGDPFVYVQGSPSAIWTVNHNIGRYPAVIRVLSPGGVEVEADVRDISVNQSQIFFASPQTGSVRVV